MMDFSDYDLSKCNIGEGVPPPPTLFIWDYRTLF